MVSHQGYVSVIVTLIQITSTYTVLPYTESLWKKYQSTTCWVCSGRN